MRWRRHPSSDPAPPALRAERNPVRIPAAAVGELAHQGQGAGYCRLRQIPFSRGLFFPIQKHHSHRVPSNPVCASLLKSLLQTGSLGTTISQKTPHRGVFCSLTSDPAPPALCAERNPVRIRRPKIGKLACQAKGVRIFAQRAKFRSPSVSSSLSENSTPPFPRKRRLTRASTFFFTSFGFCGTILLNTKGGLL